MDLTREIGDLLAERGDDGRYHAVLDRLLERFDCAVGTIHALDAESGLLTLVAQRGVPDAILDRVARIPVGKGMAGIAAERRAPVQVCNLQTDGSGIAKAGAKLTKMEGSISLPMLVDGELVGTFGVAKPVPYEFGEAETELLMRVGEVIGRHVG